MQKHFVLVVNYLGGKKCAFLTNCADLASALSEFRGYQIKNKKDILEDKSYSLYPEIVSAEIVRIVPVY